MRYSRRQFLADALMTPSAGLLCARAWSAAPGAATGAAAGAVRVDAGLFPRPDVIRYDSHCYTLHGSDTFIYSLEVPYPRVAREEWPDRFTKIRQAGFNTISTYIFWNYHERRPGVFDFTELEAFLMLAQQFGFFVIARPGPYVDAEFERGAFPSYVIARRFPVRSMHPESLRTSKHWYDHVLPVIRRHQITDGGSIILMQIENEMDFIDVPEREQREYLRFLARLAWDAGIEVPLISNVSSVVRDRSDADMAKILDVCDFYPRWSFLTDKELPTDTAGMTLEEKVGLSDRAVLASLRKMRRDEPLGPLSIAELGTGYYSKIGGKLAEDEEGADATQLNALGKTVIEHGVTYLNYYIGCGGSNRDWAGKGVTSTYDFAAPIREWGGLSAKYYEIKAIGAFLRQFGRVLVRSDVVENAARSTHPDVSVSQRINGATGFVFLRANTDAQHHFKLTFRDPVDGRDVSVPRHGQLTLGPHAMKSLAVRVPIPEGELHYSTAEILASGRSGHRAFLIVYDVPGSLIEICLRSPVRPTVTGETSYTSWNETDAAAILAVRTADSARYLVFNESLLVVVLPRPLALRSWADADAAYITDAYVLAERGADASRQWAVLRYQPGAHSLTVVVGTKPAACEVDGVAHPFVYDPGLGTTRIDIDVERAPAEPVAISRMGQRIERLDTREGTWTKSMGRVMEEVGETPFGYVKYRSTLRYEGETHAYLRAFTDNPKKVFINGRFVADASSPQRFIEFDPRPCFVRGENTIDIVYELFGSTDFGETTRLAELNGIDSCWLGNGGTHSREVSNWDVQLTPTAISGRAIAPGYLMERPSETVQITDWASEASRASTPSNLRIPRPSFLWCDADFTLPSIGSEWFVAWRMAFEAEVDAVLYVNGVFVGRYASSGPQCEFYLSPAVLRTAGSNRLTLLLAYTDTPDVIRTLRLEAYADDAAREVRVEYRW